MKRILLILTVMLSIVLSFSVPTFAAPSDSYTTFVFDPEFNSNNVRVLGSGKITKVEVMDSSKVVHATWNGSATLTGDWTTTYQWNSSAGSYYTYFVMKYVRVWYDSTAIPSITRATLLQDQISALDTNTASDSYLAPPAPIQKVPDLPLVRGQNTSVPKMTIVNYNEPQSVVKSEILPYSYSTASQVAK